MEDERLLKVSEVAERLRVRRETVLRWIKERKIRGVLVGGRRSGYRIPESELARLLRGES
jgi:excisionase family DNA binding protein